MRGREIVAAIMEKNGVTNAQLAHKLGVTIATAWDRVNSKKVKDVPLSTLDEMVRVLDYKIVIVPSDKPVLDGEYEVDSTSTVKKQDDSVDT